jgi:sugar phosphate isomerase/epimerase
MTQLLDRCKAYGYEGLEIEDKRPHGCSVDWPAKRCHEFRKQAADSGVEIACVAGNNDFSSPVPEHREANLAKVQDLIRMTSQLGAKNLRVFFAWYGGTRLPEGGGRYDIGQKIWDVAHEDFTETQAWEWCRECFVDAARWAGESGVTLALQNHRPLVAGYKDVLRMIKEVGSPHLKACIDAPLMESRDPAYLRNAVHETGKLQVHSHFGGDFEQEAPDKPVRQIRVRGGWRKDYVYGPGYIDDDVNLPFVRAMLETGYRGYLGYELCHPLPKVNGKVVGLDYADRQARLAAQFIRGVIAQAKTDLAAGKLTG